MKYTREQLISAYIQGCPLGALVVMGRFSDEEALKVWLRLQGISVS